MQVNFGLEISMNDTNYLTHRVAMHPDAAYFSILLCLMPDDFTCQGDSAGA